MREVDVSVDQKWLYSWLNVPSNWRNCVEIYVKSPSNSQVAAELSIYRKDK